MKVHGRPRKPAASTNARRMIMSSATSNNDANHKCQNSFHLSRLNAVRVQLLHGPSTHVSWAIQVSAQAGAPLVRSGGHA